MKQAQCLNCKTMIQVKEIKKGIDVICRCGCQQKCLDKSEYISRWRVVNPLNFEDKRTKQKSTKNLNIH